MLKRCLAMHDFSCVGRCSLTVAIPIISAMGVEASAIPTSVLSTHTGGFSNYTYRDLTNDIEPIVKHIKSLNTNIDSIYTGYLGKAQIGVVSESIDLLKDNKTVVLIDPVMADNGELYPGFDLEYVQLMKKYITKGNVIIPNITEACLLTGIKYKETYDKVYIESLINSLSELTNSKIVLTGVSFEDNLIGAAGKESNDIKYCFTNKIPEMYHGTGDVFASVVIGGLMNDKSLLESTSIACDFVRNSIIETRKYNLEKRYGVTFEPVLYTLREELNK